MIFRRCVIPEEIIVKVICEPNRYCCKDMKKALSEIPIGEYRCKYPTIRIYQDKKTIKLITHTSEGFGYEFKDIKYCPFCGKRIYLK